jgi:hypothetical protein
VVLFNIAECGTDATLCGTRVGARRVELGEDGSWDPFARKLKRRPEASTTRANDDRVNVDLSRFGSKCTTHAFA